MTSHKTYSEHLTDLRTSLLKTLIYICLGMFGSFFFYDKVLDAVVSPYEGKLIILSPVEGMLAAVKCCLWMGVLISSPGWLIALGRFVSPGLTPQERNWFIPFLILSYLFMGIGALFAYKITLPFTNALFTNFNSQFGENMWSLSLYLDYTLTLLFSSVVVCESTLFLFGAIHFELLNAQQLKKGRPYVVTGIFIAAALLTPPDVTTQLMVALPLCILYEIGTLYARMRQSMGSSPQD